MGYVISAQQRKIKDKRIKAVRNWSKLKSMNYIQVFLAFVNFSWKFIQDVNIKASPLTFILGISLTKLVEPLLLSVDVVGKVEVGISGDGDETVKRSLPYIKLTIRATGYLTPNVKMVFILLKNAFIKTLIFCHFDPEYYI